MAKKPADSVKPAHPTCGDCHYWHVEDEQPGDEERECYFNPPQLHVDDSGYASLRPILLRISRACGRFKGGQ